MKLFADDAGTPLFRALGGVEQGSKMLYYGLIVFGLVMIGLTVILFVLRRKFIKTKTKKHINLP